MASVELKVPLSVSAEVMWEAVVKRAKGRCPFPEMVPEVFASAEGSWLHEGSVTRFKFNNGLKGCTWTFTEVDSSAHRVKFTWVDEEGPMANRSHAITIVYVPTGEASCSINFSIQFDGQVGDEYAQALKDSFTQTTLFFTSRMSSTPQPN